MEIQFADIGIGRQFFQEGLAAFVAQRAVGQIQRMQPPHIFAVKDSLCQLVLYLAVRNPQVFQLGEVGLCEKGCYGSCVPVKAVIFNANVKEQLF